VAGGMWTAHWPITRMNASYLLKWRCFYPSIFSLRLPNADLVETTIFFPLIYGGTGTDLNPPSERPAHSGVYGGRRTAEEGGVRPG